MVKVMIMGHLGKDVAFREAKNGRKFASLNVATNIYSNGSEKTQWYDITYFNYNENVMKNMKKGSSVIIGGDLDVDLETGTDGVTRCRRNVSADYVNFGPTSGKQENSNGAQQTSNGNGGNVVEMPTMTSKEVETNVQPSPSKVVSVEDESDLPF